MHDRKTHLNKALLIFISISAMTQFAASQSRTAHARPASKAVAVAELERLDMKLGEALMRGDRKVLEDLIADDAVLLNGDGEVVSTKPELLNELDQRAGAGGPRPTVALDKVDVFFLGSTGIVISKLTFAFEVKGKAIVRRSKQIDTFSRYGDGWKLAASQVYDESAQPQSVPTVDVHFDVTIDPALMKGNKDATVVMIEFVDFQCPECRKFAAEVMDQLAADYVATGKVGLVSQNFPLEEVHPLAFGAAKAAHCAAEQGKLWEMSERMIRGTLALTPADLDQHARAVNLDTDKFARCIADPETAAAIRRDLKNGSQMGITGTPYFLIGVRKPNSTNVKAVRLIKGAFPYEVYKAALDAVITAHEH